MLTLPRCSLCLDTAPPSAQLAGRPFTTPSDGCLPESGPPRPEGRLVWDAGAMGQLEKIWSDAAAEVHQIVVGPMDNNVYVIRCRRSGEALLIIARKGHTA